MWLVYNEPLELIFETPDLEVLVYAYFRRNLVPDMEDFVTGFCNVVEPAVGAGPCTTGTSRVTLTTAPDKVEAEDYFLEDYPNPSPNFLIYNGYN